jgi:hypothetical protein
MKTKAQQSPEELDDETFAQNKFEAFGLQLKEKSGSITPIEQEQLSLLQAKMTDFWEQKKEKTSRSGFDFSKLLVSPRESVAPQLQPMWQPETPKASLKEQAMDNMMRLANGFFRANSEIIEPWKEGENSNCHGYTVTGKSGTSLRPAELLEHIEKNKNKDIGILVTNGEIAHSLVPDGEAFLHLLKGVGIVKTPAGCLLDPTMLGYEEFFFLPHMQDGLNEYLNRHKTIDNE